MVDRETHLPSTIHYPRIFAFLFLLLATIVTPAQAQEAGVNPALFEGLHYRMIGPTRGGRVTAVDGHPAHPGTFYMGSVGGGVWKTTNYGQTWRNISDGFFKTSPAMGALAIAPSDTSIIYAGTGSEGLRANVITGRGLYKSTDAGETWQFMGLEDAGQIGSIVVHPENPDLVYVAALGHPFGENEMRGVFRSKNGGATWEKVLYVSDSTGAVDLEMHPTNPNILYAAMWRAERKPWTIISGGRAGDGIYKSTDGGDTWRQVGQSNESGLPDLMGKINIAVSPAAPDRVYALVEAEEPYEGLYRFDDRGETWRLINGKDNLMHRPFYFTTLAVDPTDASVLYVGNVPFYKSTDGGETFERMDTPHVDHHALWINPENPDVMILGTDGGATVTRDGGETWSTLTNQPTAELYQVSVDDRFPYWVYGGQQDWSTISVPNLPPAESAPIGPVSWWKILSGCETGPAIPKPGNPTIVFGNCKGRFALYSRITGQSKNYWVGAQYMYGRNPAKLEFRFQRVAPIEVSPHDPGVVYHASQYVHRTTNGGVTWERISPDLTANLPQYQVISGGPITRDITGEEHYSTIYEVQVSPHDPDVIWAGANDGLVHVTRDGGATWTDVTPPNLPWGARIDGIEVSPHQPGKAYVAAHRRLLDDFHPYIYKTTDYGETWTKITDGIPDDYPVRVVREDSVREGLLYAGTSFGMFISFDDGAHWQPLQLNLPVTPVTDIALHAGDLILSTMGRSFWVLDNLSPLRQLSEEVAASKAHLFAPADAYRMRYWGGRRGGPSGPVYLPPGAIIDYYLAERPEDEITLEILDEEGGVIRTFHGAEGDPDDRYLTDSLSTAPGMHRFIWGLHYPGAWTAEGRSDNGPLAVPGVYRARLTVGDWSQTRSFRLKIDPRVAATGVTVADLREQFEFNMRLRDAISTARRTAAAVDSLRQDLKAAVDEGRVPDAEAAPVLETLEEIESALVTADTMSYPPPMLISQLSYLSWMTTSADQQLGEDAFERFAELKARLEEIRAQWVVARRRAAGLGVEVQVVGSSAN